MGSPYATQADQILPPVSDGTNNSNARYYPTTTTAANTAVAAADCGMYWILEAVGDDIHVLFSTSAAATTVDKTKVASDPALGFRLLNGVVYHFWVPKGVKWISAQSNAVAAVLRGLCTNARKSPP